MFMILIEEQSDELNGMCFANQNPHYGVLAKLCGFCFVWCNCLRTLKFDLGKYSGL